MIKCKPWKGEDLKGWWKFTYKIDGVRALVEDGIAKSRAGKLLYNLPNIPDGDYEIFCGDWESTITAVRTEKGMPIIEKIHIYPLDPIDKSLIISEVSNPTKEFINKLLGEVGALGYEGLVLRQKDSWLKVKPKETYDVPILNIQAGKGRNEGRMGALVTSLGKVGTGFTDIQREEYVTIPISTIIEVECMELTKEGKFRHPRFVRVRYDK